MLYKNKFYIIAFYIDTFLFTTSAINKRFICSSSIIFFYSRTACIIIFFRLLSQYTYNIKRERQKVILCHSPSAGITVPVLSVPLTSGAIHLIDIWWLRARRKNLALIFSPQSLLPATKRILDPKLPAQQCREATAKRKAVKSEASREKEACLPLTFTYSITLS